METQTSAPETGFEARPRGIGDAAAKYLLIRVEIKITWTVGSWVFLHP